VENGSAAGTGFGFDADNGAGDQPDQRSWKVDFRRLSEYHPFEEALVFPENPRASEVALFSGGLDSLSWAATCARADDPQPLLLVMFGDG
jgi:hypothetical protein